MLHRCKKLYTADVAAIIQTLSQIDEIAIQRAGRYLTEAQRVYCLGQGSSLVIAMEAWARFITVTQQFPCIEDAHMQAMAAALCGPQDVILFFSYAGSTRDMMDILQPAKARGARIILVTHFAKSPAAAFADVILLCDSKEGSLHSGSVAAKIGQLFLVDMLFNEYCRRAVERTSQNKDLTVQAIAGKLL